MSTHHGSRAVIFLKLFIDDKTLVAEVFRHRSARIWSWMLNVWPIDESPREFQIGLDGFLCVIRIPDNQAADHVHFVLMHVLNRFNRRIAELLTVHTRVIFG